VKNTYIYNKVKNIATADLKSAVSILIQLLFSACGAEDSISTLYPCQFIFRTNLHPGTSIETALNSAGTYTMVSAEKKNGVWHIYSTLNDGKNHTDEYILTTSKENYANYSYLGAGNDLKDATKNGFILGKSIYGSVDNIPPYRAWDRQCLNCINQYGGRNYPLEWTGNRQEVKCSKCNRTYSLDTGAVTGGAKGKPLMRYNVSYSGTGSTLTVGN